MSQETDPETPPQTARITPLDPLDPLDQDLLAEDARRRPGKLTLALAAALVLVGAFGAGVLVQKQAGGATSSGPGGPTTQAGGSGAGGFPGGGGAPGGGPGAALGETAQSPGGAAGASEAEPDAGTPLVVGTVQKISATTLTVRNFAGKRVAVTVAGDATVTGPRLTGVVKGDTVAVTGTAEDDGSVTATSVTVRK